MARRRRLRVAPDRALGRRRLPFLIASFLLIGVLVVGVVSVQALVSQTSFRMQELTRQVARLEQGVAAKRLDVAKLSSPGRMAREAEHLGFRMPESGELHTITVRSPTRQGDGEPVNGSTGAPSAGAEARP